MSLDWAPELLTTVCVVLYLSSLQLVLNHDKFLFTGFQPGLEPLIHNLFSLRKKYDSAWFVALSLETSGKPEELNLKTQERQ
ncbi:hypothetical protein INR49_014127 [Caranx melampygus]|nr:hypothetical protein INR49_014127 [Caranx melampygus]